MPSLNFDKRWVDLILSGKKKQTIRRVGKRKYETGQTLFLCTGLQTKYCRRLGQATCKRVVLLRRTRAGWAMQSQIVGGWRRGLMCFIGLLASELLALALADGFESLNAFEAWFARYPVRQYFYLIEWDEVRHA